MALLKTAWSSRALAALMALSGAGCMLLERFGEREPARLVFSHELHVVEEELECVSCHESADVSDEPGMPALDTCTACHDTLDADKPAERRVESLFTDGVFQAARASRLADEQIFSHRQHVRANQDCGVCHEGIRTDRRITRAIGVTMERCMDCHAGRDVPNDCESCHEVIREEWEPPSHHHNWKALHGQTVRAGSSAAADTCALCHQESLCITCHKEEPPANHNNFFRLRGHGVLAMMDRQNCAACHEPDSCERCHSEVLPQSHRGLWGAPKDTHCLACHFPLASEGCVACHKDTNSHLLATPLPTNPSPPVPPHNPAMNCRQCHGVTAPLPHVDKGDECILCHM